MSVISRVGVVVIMVAKVVIRSMANEYYCYDLVDMCKIDAVKGDIACVIKNNGRYMYNGVSWTKKEIEYPTPCLDCVYLKISGGCAILRQDELTGGRCPYWRSFMDKPSESKKRHDPTPYFDQPPYYIGYLGTMTIGNALSAAWSADEDRVWINSRHVDGLAKIGDSFTVRGKRWVVIAVDIDRYLLKRITNPLAYVDTPKLRVGLISSR